MVGKRLVLVHGHGPKPGAQDLERLWRSALLAGLARDCPDQVDAFHELPVDFVYYGDWNNRIVVDLEPPYDESLDVLDREHALERLIALDRSRKFRRNHYERLPGKSSFKEFLADVGLPIAFTLGLGRRALSRLVPELGEYWAGGEFRDAIADRLGEPLRASLARGEDVMLISHGCGSVFAYDCLWDLSWRQGLPNKVSFWVTAGSPLGDETVKRQLQGAGETGERRYPNNLVAWHNVSAEDDYMCHDATVADDFSPMLKRHMLSVIQDRSVYNMTVRFNRSNPHSALGYLVHPVVARLLGGWLT